jgi:hypothetical protein
MDTGSSLNFTEDIPDQESFEFKLSPPKTTATSLYSIEYDSDSGMLKAVFNRDEEVYVPEGDETYNFRFFYYLKDIECRLGIDLLRPRPLEDDQVTYLSDRDLILDISDFYGQLNLGHIDPNQEYFLMRWSPGFDCWTASKFNKFKAKEFKKRY